MSFNKLSPILGVKKQYLILRRPILLMSAGKIGRRAAVMLPTSLNAATAICSPYSLPSSP